MNDGAIPLHSLDLSWLFLVLTKSLLNHLNQNLNILTFKSVFSLPWPLIKREVRLFGLSNH